MSNFPQVTLAIIGAQKAGTTSLSGYLSQCKNIANQLPVEFDFFLNDKSFALGFDSYATRFLSYSSNQRIVIKNVTLSVSDIGMSRLRDHSPDSKIVLILREPVDRIYSSLRMAVSRGWLDRDFDLFCSSIQSNKNNMFYRNFLLPGLYADQVKRVSSYFPSDSVRIYLYEDLRDNANDLTLDILDWIGEAPYRIDLTPRNVTHARDVKFPIVALGLNHFYRSKLSSFLKGIFPYSWILKIKSFMESFLFSKRSLSEPLMSEKLERLVNDFYEGPTRELRKCVDSLGLNVRTFGSSCWF